MPTPVSATSTAIVPSVGLYVRTAIEPPSGVNFTALRSRFQKIWLSRAASPST
jgi:hypothetical protein